MSPPHAGAPVLLPVQGDMPVLRAPGRHGWRPGTGFVLLERGRGGVSPQDERATTPHNREVPAWR
ncbi:hypothetical protein, partial [Streptomyces erythrochromogenes]|uniref:hypothetical protein n=1 Tax=Streptomyces erythrochromogenes TaxID=285574 RepID=UPI001ADF470F